MKSSIPSRFLKRLLMALILPYFLLSVHNCSSEEGQPVVETPTVKEVAEVQEDGEAAETESPIIDLPIPVGQEVKGIKIPYFDNEGAKQMEFFAEQARRVDEQNVQMSKVKIKTFDEMGDVELDFILPVSVFDLEQQLLSSDKSVVIKRKDFHITGESMVFNVRSRVGRLGGEVNMIIFDRKNLN